MTNCWKWFALLLAFSPLGRLRADSPEAVAAIEKAGGVVRLLVEGQDDLEVAFHLSGRELTDRDLQPLAALKNVTELNLKGAQIQGPGLVHLKNLSQLKRLHLEQTQVGDEGVAHLEGLANLEYLNLYGAPISDQGLQHLAGLKRLRRLYLWQTKTTAEGRAKLQKALPELEIIGGVDLSKLPKANPAHSVEKDRVALKWTAAKVDPPQSQTGSNMRVLFENKSGRPVKVYWMSYEGERVLYAQLPAGGSHDQNTYSRAIWLIADANDKPLGYFTTGAEDAKAVIPK